MAVIWAAEPTARRPRRNRPPARATRRNRPAVWATPPNPPGTIAADRCSQLLPAGGFFLGACRLPNAGAASHGMFAIFIINSYFPKCCRKHPGRLLPTRHEHHRCCIVMLETGQNADAVVSTSRPKPNLPLFRPVQASLCRQPLVQPADLALCPAGRARAYPASAFARQANCDIIKATFLVPPGLFQRKQDAYCGQSTTAGPCSNGVSAIRKGKRA